MTTILPVSEFNVPNEFLILATEQGWIKKTSLVAFENLSSRGLIVATLEPGDRFAICKLLSPKRMDIIAYLPPGRLSPFARKSGRLRS